jgi:hypothetical protein
VLVTSLSRRTYKDGKVVEDLNDYAKATREVGAKNFITVVDLNSISTKLLDGMTQADADTFDRGNDPATGRPAAKPASTSSDDVARTATGIDAAKPASMDRTHLNDLGKKVFGRIVADQLIRTQVELGPDVIGEPTAPPK